MDFVSECFRSINQKPTVTSARKMPKNVFLNAGFRTVKFSVIAFINIPCKSESVYSLTHILFQAFSASY